MTTENPVRIQIGKRYRGERTGNIYTVVSHTSEGYYCRRDDGEDMLIGLPAFLPIEGESYEDEEEKIVRKIKTTAPNIIQDPDASLREIEIKLGEVILLKIDGQETPIQVRFEHKHFFKDDSPKRAERLELSGVVIPQEIKKIRLIRR